MTLRTSKPAFNVRDALNSLKKKTGILGESLMRAETASDVYNAIGTNRNLLPNGDFKIWQRGTSQSKASPSYGYFGPDQTVVYYVGTYEQTSVTLPSRVNTTALKNTLGSGTVAPNFSFPIENGGKFLRGQTVTASWWMRASKSRAMNNRFDNVAQGNYGGAGYALYDLVNPLVNTYWTYYTRTFTLPETMSYDHVHFEVYGNTADWTQNDWFEIAQVQVELGPVATPFEQRAHSTELALCQRYCQVLGGASTNEVMASGSGNVSNVTSQLYKPCVPFRTIPTLSYSALGHFEIQAVGSAIYVPTVISLISSISSAQYIYFDLNHTSGGTTGAVQFLRAANTSARLIFSAEF